MPDTMNEDQLLEAAGPVYGPALYEKFKDANGMVAKDQLIAISEKTDVFLSYDWGTDEEGRDNHDRIARINDALQAAGLVTWFDKECVGGDIVRNSIENASVIAVFLSKSYIDKVENNDKGYDLCQQEFFLARARRSPKFMLPIVMEKACQNPSEWTGPVRVTLGSTVPINCVEESDEERAINEIVEAVEKKVRLLLAPGEGRGPNPEDGDWISPTSDEGLPDSCTTSIHEHTLHRNMDDVDWRCNGVLQEGGCACGYTGYPRETSGWVKYTCSGCEFDLCKGCVMKWSDGTQGQGQDLDGASVSIHGHPLFRSNVDNGWACDGRKQQGGCKGGCTGFKQTGGWERYHCADCKFDLCRACVESFIAN